jgi:hypothetical protein
LEFSLNGEWSGGDLVIYPDPKVPAIEAVDNLSRSYDLRAWESGVMSGAFHAFRALDSSRRRIVVTDFRGTLGSTDMTALATATALGVAKLLERALPGADLAEWTSSISVLESANGKV